MTHFILVRHGESEANGQQRFAASGDIVLTERGRSQALAVANLIGLRFKPVRVVSSYFLRARQTAEIITKFLDLPLSEVANFHERDLGVLKGKEFPAYLDIGTAIRHSTRNRNGCGGPPRVKAATTCVCGSCLCWKASPRVIRTRNWCWWGMGL